MSEPWSTITHLRFSLCSIKISPFKAAPFSSTFSYSYSRQDHRQPGRSESRAETKRLTEINGQLRVVVSLSVGDEVDLVLPPLLLEALLGAPVLANAAAYQDNDERPHQPEPCKKEEPPS